MGRSSKHSVIEIALQSGKGVQGTNWYQLPVTRNNIQHVEDFGVLPEETGSVPFQQGAYKSGYMVAGTMDLVLRADLIGLLLKLVVGNEAAVDNLDGTYTHTFTVDLANPFDQQYFTLRKRLAQDAANVGDIYTDCVIAGLTINVANRGVITAQAQVLGITADKWDPASAPLAITDNQFFVPCIGASEWPVGSTPTGGFVGAQFTFQNVTTTLEQEQNIGQYTADDITILTRQGSLSLTHKVVDHTLYHQISGLSGGAWDPAVTFSSAKVEVGVPGTTPQHTLTIEVADETSWNIEPVDIAPPNLVYMQMTGRVLRDYSGDDPVTISLLNSRATYYDSANTAI